METATRQALSPGTSLGELSDGPKSPINSAMYLKALRTPIMIQGLFLH